MSWIRIIGILVGLLILGIFLLALYYGAFKTVKVKEREERGFYFVFERYIGPYSNSSKIMDKLYESLLKDKIECTVGFGAYYDDPNEVDSKKCRSLLGDVITDEQYKKIQDNVELVKKYNTAYFPGGPCVVSSFPFLGFPSVILGIFKVYPKMKNYMKRKKYEMRPCLELYDIPAKLIRYIWPYSVDMEFFDRLMEEKEE